MIIAILLLHASVVTTTFQLPVMINNGTSITHLAVQLNSAGQRWGPIEVPNRGPAVFENLPDSLVGHLGIFRIYDSGSGQELWTESREIERASALLPGPTIVIPAAQEAALRFVPWPVGTIAQLNLTCNGSTVIDTPLQRDQWQASPGELHQLHDCFPGDIHVTVTFVDHTGSTLVHASTQGFSHVVFTNQATRTAIDAPTRDTTRTDEYDGRAIAGQFSDVRQWLIGVRAGWVSPSFTSGVNRRPYPGVMAGLHMKHMFSRTLAFGGEVAYLNKGSHWRSAPPPGGKEYLARLNYLELAPTGYFSPVDLGLVRIWVMIAPITLAARLSKTIGETPGQDCQCADGVRHVDLGLFGGIGVALQAGSGSIQLEARYGQGWRAVEDVYTALPLDAVNRWRGLSMAYETGFRSGSRRTRQMPVQGVIDRTDRTPGLIAIREGETRSLYDGDLSIRVDALRAEGNSYMPIFVIRSPRDSPITIDGASYADFKSTATMSTYHISVASADARSAIFRIWVER